LRPRRVGSGDVPQDLASLGLRTLVLPRVEILDTLHAPSETRIAASNRVR
jgi:hypothetical protein